MYKLDIQALSQNMAWVGKRYKSKAYRQYQQDVKTYLLTFDLPKIEPKEPFYLWFEFGLPSRCDLSNCIKLLEDIIADHLGVNDRDTMKLHGQKVITKRSESYIKFDIFTDKQSFSQRIIAEM